MGSRPQDVAACYPAASGSLGSAGMVPVRGVQGKPATHPETTDGTAIMDVDMEQTELIPGHQWVICERGTRRVYTLKAVSPGRLHWLALCSACECQFDVETRPEPQCRDFRRL
jgi:hypothetical protein